MLERTVRRKLAQARHLPGFLLASASAVTWALTTRTKHSYDCGFDHGLNMADKFLDRYPDIQNQFRDFVKRR